MNDRYVFLTDPHRKSFTALTRIALQQLLSKSHPPPYRRHIITTWTLNLSGREDLTVQGALVKKKNQWGSIAAKCGHAVFPLYLRQTFGTTCPRS